jgi:N4-gp56 family major capsid protein
VANVYTSVNTTGSFVDALVKPAYDLAVGYNLRTYASARQFVTKKPERPDHKGSSVTLTKFSDFSAATIAAAKTPLVEESSPDSVKAPQPTTVTVTPNEYGFVVIRTEKLWNRTFTDIDPEIARAVAQHMSWTLDELIQDVFVTGTNVAYANSRASENLLTTGDVLTARDLRTVHTQFQLDGVTPWDGQFYGAFVSPAAINDLRQETGSGGWRVPNEYGSNQSDIWRGEMGEFEGFRFVQNSRVRQTNTGASSATVTQNYFFGRDAFVEERVYEPHVVIGPVVDPLKRFYTVGWKGDLGWAIYEQKAVRRVVSKNSL